MLWPTVLVGVYGMFTANLGVTLAAYAQSVFRSGASGYGLLSSVLAVGAIVGALISMRWRRAGLDGLTATGLTLATLYMVSAAAPTQWSYGILLVAVGAVTLLLHTSANSMVQLGAPDALRGRVMALYLFVFFGTAAIGGPLIGAIDEHLGPRAGMFLAGTIPGAATIAIVAARRRRHRRAHRDVAAAN
jgi:MFS family permease